MQRPFDLVWTAALRMRFQVFFIVLCLPSSAALADVATLAQYGAWRVFGGSAVDGVPVCGMSSMGTDGRAFMIKYFNGTAKLTIQIHKPSWAIPEGHEINIRMQFDEQGPWTVTAKGYGNMIEFFVPGGDQLRQFSNELRWSNQFRVWFLNGSEGAWIAGLSGSNAAVGAMLACMNRMPSSNPSQPFDQRGTQPFDQRGSTSQPFIAPPLPFDVPADKMLNPKTMTPSSPAGSRT